MFEIIEPTNGYSMMRSMKKIRSEIEYHAQAFRRLRHLYRQNEKRLKSLAIGLPAHSIMRIEIVSFLKRKK